MKYRSSVSIETMFWTPLNKPLQKRSNVFFNFFRQLTEMLRCIGCSSCSWNVRSSGTSKLNINPRQDQTTWQQKAHCRQTTVLVRPSDYLQTLEKESMKDEIWNIPSWNHNSSYYIVEITKSELWSESKCTSMCLRNVSSLASHVIQR